MRFPAGRVRRACCGALATRCGPSPERCIHESGTTTLSGSKAEDGSESFVNVVDQDLWQ